MARLLRNDAAKQMPAGVKKARWSPVVVIPSAGIDPRAAGLKLANMRRKSPQSRPETEVRIRYLPTCDEHKQAIKLETLESQEQLRARCKRLTDQLGHGTLSPESARLEWEPLDDGTPCSDCMDAAESKARKEAAA